MTHERRHTMKKLLLPILCTLMLCGCANTPPTETTASMETTTPTETTSAETTTMETSTAETTTETTTEEPIATETTYIESLGETKVKLSTMSEEDLRKFFTDAGLNIPKMYERFSLRELVINLEKDPFYEHGINITLRFDTYARILVSKYYNMPNMYDEWFPDGPQPDGWTEINPTNTLPERD